MTIEEMIRNAAAKYGLSGDYLVRIAVCESTLGVNLVNYHYTAPDGSHPTGVFQFTRETWLDLAPNVGYPLQDDRMNNEMNIELAAWAFAHGNAWRWECR